MKDDDPTTYIALMLRLLTGNLFNKEPISEELADAAMVPFVELMMNDSGDEE